MSKGTRARGQDTIAWAGISTSGGSLPKCAPPCTRRNKPTGGTGIGRCRTCGAPTIPETFRSSHDGKTWTTKVVHRCTRYAACRPFVEAR